LLFNKTMVSKRWELLAQGQAWRESYPRCKQKPHLAGNQSAIIRIWKPQEGSERIQMEENEWVKDKDPLESKQPQNYQRGEAARSRIS
jgi:hypothetical protein